ncbi:MAG: hypothetical protein PHC56_08245 [Herbinix sp.]|nr:hypothetical protein [Herbinix sp.]
MNVKLAAKYQLNEYIKSIKIYYLVLVLIMLFFGIIASVERSDGVSYFGGIESTTMIFLFILGLNSFKETFLMMLQNGITRKSMFIGRLITILVTSISMTVIDRLVNSLGELVNNSKRVKIGRMYEMTFPKRAESLHVIVVNLEAILIIMGIYIAAMVAGYFITTAYYRMNKVLKIIASIGVPALFFVLLPIFDLAVFKGKISTAMGRMFRFMSGGDTGNPYNLLLTCLVFSVVAVGLTWLLIRKAVEKN